jgi:beta-1,2-mannobiose phosphorylase / 1,2-beta-oligomannan phosphorylase
MLRRLFNACLLRPEDLKPSDDRLEVVGCFNPGAISWGDDVLLLARIAEMPKERRQGFTGFPRWTSQEGLTIDWLANDDLVFIDPRVVLVEGKGVVRLTFISHIRTVRCKQGRSLLSAEGSRLTPEAEYEEYGVEDPRITRIGDTYYVTYVAVSRHGAATALASTVDFVSFRRHGIIFPCENKDVLLFPEKIGGEYVAFHRPNPATHFSPPEMWLARSADLVRWGRHEPFYSGKGVWETSRIGGGAPPFRTDRGWVEIYHGNKKGYDEKGVGVYSAGAFLLDLDNPQRVLGRTDEPMIVPETDYETRGFVPNVIFPTGVVEREETLLLYYGAADTCTAVAEFSKKELLSLLK